MNEKFVLCCMRRTRRVARFIFRKRPNRAELIEDAVSEAWRFAMKAPPAATSVSIAHHAVLRVQDNRQFRESVRSVTHPKHYGWKMVEGGVPYCSPRDNPAEIVATLIDGEAWFQSLSPRMLKVAVWFAQGYGNSEIAAMLGLSFARVSQLRQELFDSWREFTSH